MGTSLKIPGKAGISPINSVAALAEDPDELSAPSMK